MLSLFLTSAATGLTGCVSWESERGLQSYSIADPNLLTEIRPGITTTDWLKQHFGEPSHIMRRDAHDIWQYENVQSNTFKLRAIPLVSVKSEKHERTLFNFEVQGNVIMDHWREALPNKPRKRARDDEQNDAESAATANRPWYKKLFG